MKTKYADVREDASVLDKIYKQIEVDDYEFNPWAKISVSPSPLSS